MITRAGRGRLAVRGGALLGAMTLIAVLAGCAGGASPAAMTDRPAPATTSSRPTPTVTPTPATLPAAPALTAAQQAQLDYALKYWKDYNSAVYGDDNPNGGDCANFVSQTLIARGWKMNSVWYNHGQNAMSPAWAYVPAMQQYFQDNAAQLGLVQLGAEQRSQYAVGDVVIFWWRNADGGYGKGPDHVQVIDKIVPSSEQPQILMASHNLDYDYRDLDNEITVEHPGAKFVVWHLTTDTNG